jgi:hypothetical protein
MYAGIVQNTTPSMYSALDRNLAHWLAFFVTAVDGVRVPKSPWSPSLISHPHAIPCSAAAKPHTPTPQISLRPDVSNGEMLGCAGLGCMGRVCPFRGHIHRA